MMRLLVAVVLMAGVLVVAAATPTSTTPKTEKLKKVLQEELEKEMDEEDDTKRGDLWAVLVAGSNEWMNYRHQADVCHAYQILHQHGVPDDRIIVMMYDDIAHNEMNPMPGVIINRPDGPNVYQGVPKDYVGPDVTPEIFLKVLSGDAEGLKGIGSGKVVKSGPNDRIFVNMVDHGAPGIFAFPNEYLNATALADTLLAMRKDGKFRELVLYMEACESGSMFQNLLPNDIEVYAVSASSPHQPSYACYQDNKLGVFLGDVFSIKWMEDSDRENLRQETLKRQFLLVRSEVVTSTVMHWGELRLAGQKLARFLGSQEPSHHHLMLAENDLHQLPRVYPSKAPEEDPCLNSSVPTYDVPLALLKSKILNAQTKSEKSKWENALTNIKLKRQFAEWLVKRLVLSVTGDEDITREMLRADHTHDITSWTCYHASVRALHLNCLHLTKNPYVLRLLDSLVNLCQHGYSADRFRQATRAVCSSRPIFGIV